MCLVSFLKTPQGNVVLTSNRDEAPTRTAENLEEEVLDRQSILYPIDVKGGSWFVVGSSGMVAIILNGAFENHKRILPYRLSRGVMVKALFEYSTPNEFLATYDFNNIEPFTLVIYSDNQLLEFRWDGSKKYIEILDVSECHVWSSCTLYTPEMQKLRQQEFMVLVKKQNQNAEDILKIHLTGTVGDKGNDFVMNREDRVKTMSVTQAEVKNSTIELKYKNLIFNADLLQNMAIEK